MKIVRTESVTLNLIIRIVKLIASECKLLEVMRSGRTISSTTFRAA